MTMPATRRLLETREGILAITIMMNSTGRNALKMLSVTRATFTNADLSSGILTITHSDGLSAPYTLHLTVSDNNYKQIIPDEVTFGTNTITVDLTSYGTISGTWGYYYI